MDFTIQILGSGAAVPTLKRNPSAHFVDCLNRHILIDCAEGTQHLLRKNGVKIQKIQIILISHLHGDHYFGLVGLISTMHLLGRTSGLTIYGPKELEQIIRMQLEVGGHRMGFDIHFEVLDTKDKIQIFEDSKIKIHTFPLKHRIPTFGFLIEEKSRGNNLRVPLLEEDKIPVVYYDKLKEGKDVVLDDGRLIRFEMYTTAPSVTRSYAYCSDTKYDENLVSFIENVTLLYHEATFLNDMQSRAKATFHSTAREASLIAKKSKAKHLILGHFSARYQHADAHLTEARTEFDSVFSAEDGRIFSIQKDLGIKMIQE